MESSQPQRWSVLVVDDDAEFRDALSAYLALEGFSVSEACDGIDALGCIDRIDTLDALVCDLDMPLLDGPSLVRRLRSRGDQHVIVMMSAHFDMLAVATDLGQVYAMSKPLSGSDLVRMLREALEGRS